MNSVEVAYQHIANVLLNHIEPKPWARLIFNSPIFNEGLGGAITEQEFDSDKKIDIPVGLAIFDLQTAALFLRDDLLKTTGKRIWGLTFTLYPTGKFNIDYDYNKPEDYEETDETISFDEAFKQLPK